MKKISSYYSSRFNEVPKDGIKRADLARLYPERTRQAVYLFADKALEMGILERTESKRQYKIKVHEGWQNKIKEDYSQYS